MNERRQWAAALTIMFTLLCMVILFAPGAVAEFINWSHFDALWADHGLGSSGPVIVDVPTAQLTATPAVRVRNPAADGNSFEAQNASATPVWQVDKDGNVTAASLTTGGTLGVTGLSTLTGGASVPLNVENTRLPSVATKAFTYTAAAGATYTGFVFPAGEKILVHSVLANVTTNFDCTGDDCTLAVGDANDADGYLVLADAELQADDTEGTGFAVGWQGTTTDTIGVYLENTNAFPVVAPAGGYTITYALGETSGDTLAGGAATLYLLYTKLE